MCIYKSQRVNRNQYIFYTITVKYGWKQCQSSVHYNKVWERLDSTSRVWLLVFACFPLYPGLGHSITYNCLECTENWFCGSGAVLLTCTLLRDGRSLETVLQDLGNLRKCKMKPYLSAILNVYTYMQCLYILIYIVLYVYAKICKTIYKYIWIRFYKI